MAGPTPSRLSIAEHALVDDRQQLADPGPQWADYGHQPADNSMASYDRE